MSTTRICAHCATRFDTERANKRYCSGACRSAASRARRRRRGGRATEPATDTPQVDHPSLVAGTGVSNADLDAALGLADLDAGLSMDTSELEDRVALLEATPPPEPDWTRIDRAIQARLREGPTAQLGRLGERVDRVELELSRLGRRPSQPPPDRALDRRLTALERRPAEPPVAPAEVRRLRDEVAAVRRKARAAEQELAERVAALEEQLEGWASVMGRVVDLVI